MTPAGPASRLQVPFASPCLAFDPEMAVSSCGRWRISVTGPLQGGRLIIRPQLEDRFELGAGSLAIYYIHAVLPTALIPNQHWSCRVCLYVSGWRYDEESTLTTTVPLPKFPDQQPSVTVVQFFWPSLAAMVATAELRRTRKRKSTSR
jgi:hypothetical protein